MNFGLKKMVDSRFTLTGESNKNRQTDDCQTASSKRTQNSPKQGRSIGEKFGARLRGPKGSRLSRCFLACPSCRTAVGGGRVHISGGQDIIRTPPPDPYGAFLTKKKKKKGVREKIGLNEPPGTHPYQPTKGKRGLENIFDHGRQKKIRLC